MTDGTRRSNRLKKKLDRLAVRWNESNEEELEEFQNKKRKVNTPQKQTKLEEVHPSPVHRVKVQDEDKKDERIASTNLEMTASAPNPTALDLVKRYSSDHGLVVGPIHSRARAAKDFGTTKQLSTSSTNQSSAKPTTDTVSVARILDNAPAVGDKDGGVEFSYDEDLEDEDNLVTRVKSSVDIIEETQYQLSLADRPPFPAPDTASKWNKMLPKTCTVRLHPVSARAAGELAVSNQQQPVVEITQESFVPKEPLVISSQSAPQQCQGTLDMTAGQDTSAGLEDSGAGLEVIDVDSAKEPGGDCVEANKSLMEMGAKEQLLSQHNLPSTPIPFHPENGSCVPQAGQLGLEQRLLISGVTIKLITSGGMEKLEAVEKAETSLASGQIRGGSYENFDSEQEYAEDSDFDQEETVQKSANIPASEFAEATKQCSIKMGVKEQLLNPSISFSRVPRLHPTETMAGFSTGPSNQEMDKVLVTKCKEVGDKEKLIIDLTVDVKNEQIMRTDVNDDQVYTIEDENVKDEEPFSEIENSTPALAASQWRDDGKNLRGGFVQPRNILRGANMPFRGRGKGGMVPHMAMGFGMVPQKKVSVSQTGGTRKGGIMPKQEVKLLQMGGFLPQMGGLVSHRPPLLAPRPRFAQVDPRQALLRMPFGLLARPRMPVRMPRMPVRMPRIPVMMPRMPGRGRQAAPPLQVSMSFNVTSPSGNKSEVKINLDRNQAGKIKNLLDQ